MKNWRCFSLFLFLTVLAAEESALVTWEQIKTSKMDYEDGVFVESKAPWDTSENVQKRANVLEQLRDLAKEAGKAGLQLSAEKLMEEFRVEAERRALATWTWKNSLFKASEEDAKWSGDEFRAKWAESLWSQKKPSLKNGTEINLSEIYKVDLSGLTLMTDSGIKRYQLSELSPDVDVFLGYGQDLVERMARFQAELEDSEDEASAVMPEKKPDDQKKTIVSFDAKKVKSGSGYTHVSWKCVLRNAQPRDRVADVKFSFLDSDGFELDSARKYSVKLASGKAVTLNEVTMMEDDVWERVESFQVEIK